ncbi:MAG: DNA-processing protein DprA, partial [Candidatus Gastranaerophilales bacterium]|nr:DNA-processing protein DprA [Candidatus Gastranaerophilales bacterium]
MKQKTNQLKIAEVMDNDKLKYYVAFSFLNVQPIFKSRIFEYFDYDIVRAFNVDEKDLQSLCEYYEMNIPREYLKKRDSLNIDECLKKAFENEVKILTYEDEKYPQILREIPDFPLALYYKGDIDSIDFNYNFAIVGSRNASDGSKIALETIVAGLKNTNITIVSGLAYGIDTQAHKSAIDNGLKTIAVIGCGLDRVYPAQNKKLFNDIINTHGVVISEYPVGTPPL